MFLARLQFGADYHVQVISPCDEIPQEFMNAADVVCLHFLHKLEMTPFCHQLQITNVVDNGDKSCCL